MEIQKCLGCERSFFVLADNCPDHCKPACCRKAGCPHAKPKYMAQPRTCKTCGGSSIPSRYWSGFESFAPCDEGCNRFYYHTEQIWRCLVHHPNGKPRIHQNWCSLKCYNSETSGFLESRRRRSRRRRNVRNQHKMARRLFRGREKVGGETIRSKREWWEPLRDQS